MEEVCLKQHLEQKEKEWESLCIRCGGCCGAFDDPCRHLKKDKDNQYYCEIYPFRFGERVTHEGEIFDCVPIREILHTSWKKDWLCPYKKYMRRKWSNK